MIRVIVKDIDFGDAVHIGAQPVSRVKSFEIQNDALEKHLREYHEKSDKARNGGPAIWWNREVVGVELI